MSDKYKWDVIGDSCSCGANLEKFSCSHVEVIFCMNCMDEKQLEEFTLCDECYAW